MAKQFVEYSFLKEVIEKKGLTWQYVESDTDYSIFAVDGCVTYVVLLYKAGYEPIGCEDCAANTLDFETTNKLGANTKMEEVVKFNEQQVVGITKPNIGQRAWVFSHNFCDKTTWYGDSIRVTNESVGTGNGATVTFNLDHQYVIDLSHGKVSDEDFLAPSYAPMVTVNGVTLTEAPFGETGDYTINYVDGTVTFMTPPANSAAIIASYSYSPLDAGSTLYLTPEPGYKLTITVAEAQFSEDFAMTDNLLTSVWTYYPPAGDPPARFEYPPSRSRYKRVLDFVNYTLGSFPIIPALDASGPRGLAQPIVQLRYDYQSALVIDSSIGAQLRVWMEHHRPYTGFSATIAFYGYQEPL